MAFGGTAAKLEILLTAKDEATKKLMGLTSAVEQSAARMKQIGAGMMAIGTAGALAIGAGLRSVINYNEEILRLSKITGLSIEDTQKWRYAITQSEGDFEAFTQTFLKLNMAREKALSGGKTQQKAFQDLGVSLIGVNGKAKSTNDILLELSDKLKSGTASENDLANATELLGRGGKALVPLLREGRDAITSFFKEAEKAGLISTEQSKAIDKLGDRIAALQLPAMKIKAAFATAVAPALERLADLAEKVMNVFSSMSPKMQAFIVRLLSFGSALLIVAGAGLVFKGMLAGLAVFKWAVISSGLQTIALKAMFFKDALMGTNAQALILIGTLLGVWYAVGKVTEAMNWKEAGEAQRGLIKETERLMGLYRSGKINIDQLRAGMETPQMTQWIDIKTRADSGDMTPKWALPEVFKSGMSEINNMLSGIFKTPTLEAAEVGKSLQNSLMGVGAGSELGAAIKDVTLEEYLTEKNKVYLDTIRITKGQTFYELESLRLEREAFRAHFAEKKDLLQDYEAYYIAAVAKIKREDLGGFNQSSFGIENYMPSMLSVAGNMSGSVKQGMNILNFTIYADDRRVGEAVQSALNKSL